MATSATAKAAQSDILEQEESVQTKVDRKCSSSSDASTENGKGDATSAFKNVGGETATGEPTISLAGQAKTAVTELKKKPADVMEKLSKPAKTAAKNAKTDKALMAEKVVDKGLQLLSLTLPPLTAVLATDFSRDKLGVQVSLMAACLASLVPALLLGTWSWARSRMAVRVSEATKRMQLAVSYFHDYEKLAKAVLKADPSNSETGELQSDFDSICSNVGSFVAGVDSYKKIYGVA